MLNYRILCLVQSKKLEQHQKRSKDIEKLLHFLQHTPLFEGNHEQPQHHE